MKNLTLLFILIFFGACNTTPNPSPKIVKHSGSIGVAYEPPALKDTRRISIIVFPEIHPVYKNGKPWILSAKEVDNIAFSKFPGIRGVDGIADRYYVVIEQDSLLQAAAYARTMIRELGWEWITANWDCDNYAAALDFVVQKGFSNTHPEIAAEPLFGEVNVKADNAWAGVGGIDGKDSYHAINAGATNDNDGDGFPDVFFAEPQNGLWGINNSERRDYPNFNTVYRIRL